MKELDYRTFEEVLQESTVDLLRSGIVLTFLELCDKYDLSIRCYKHFTTAFSGCRSDGVVIEVCLDYDRGGNLNIPTQKLYLFTYFDAHKWVLCFKSLYCQKYINSLDTLDNMLDVMHKKYDLYKVYIKQRAELEQQIVELCINEQQLVKLLIDEKQTTKS